MQKNLFLLFTPSLQDAHFEVSLRTYSEVLEMKHMMTERVKSECAYMVNIAPCKD
jgi:hypothetical protein